MSTDFDQLVIVPVERRYFPRIDEFRWCMFVHDYSRGPGDHWVNCFTAAELDGLVDEVFWWIELGAPSIGRSD